MKIIYFGDYNTDYARNRVLLRGLLLSDVEVIECRTDKKGAVAKKELKKKFAHIPTDYDCVVVGYSDSRWVVPFVKKHTKKPIVWDAFYSKYDSWIRDKKLARRFSIKAVYYWLSDWYSCLLADCIVLDTQAHADYFHKTFFVSNQKLFYLYVGTDDTVMTPQPAEEQDIFLVSFLGKYIPLQGPQYIVQAAKLLEKNTNIHFQMIGSGQLQKMCKKLAQDVGAHNIHFIDRVAYEDIPKVLAPADVCLGIFGDTDKTQRVIPNKVFEAAALRKAIISADTPAIHELFTDEKDILLCKTANPKSLAAAIQRLYDDIDLRERIATGAYDTFQSKATPEIVGKKFISLLQRFV